MTLDEVVLSELRCDGGWVTVSELQRSMWCLTDPHKKAAYQINDDNLYDEILKALFRLKLNGEIELRNQRGHAPIEAKWLSPLDRLATIK
jgi:hypothetical protein